MKVHTAIIKKCKKSDLTDDRPLSEQKYCLYAHPRTKKEKEMGHGRLLGRHPNKESAIKQEQAIKARQSDIALYAMFSLADEIENKYKVQDGADKVAVACVGYALGNVCSRTAYATIEVMNIKNKLGSSTQSIFAELVERSRSLIASAKKKIADEIELKEKESEDNSVPSAERFAIWWDGEQEMWVVSDSDGNRLADLTYDKHASRKELIDLARDAISGKQTEKDFYIIPFEGDIIYS